MEKDEVQTDSIVVNMSREEYEKYVKWIESGSRLIVSKLPLEDQKAIRCQKVKEWNKKKKAEDPDEYRRQQTEKKRAYRAKLKAQSLQDLC